MAERRPKLAEYRPRPETPPVKPVKIAIKTKGTILLIHPGEILAVEAEGNYVLLRRSTDSYLLRESISAMAEKLQPHGFIRIHRSVLVNTSSAEELQPGTNGEYVLRLTGGREYMVSRTYKNNLKSLAHSWIGTDSFVDE
jgi:two-component system LytT family response regulator